MDVASGYTYIQSETGLGLRMVRRMYAFDGYPFGPGGLMPKCDCEDIKREDFSDVTTPVFFNNRVADQAGYENVQIHRRAIERAPNYDGSTECGSRWPIPQAESYPGCPYEPVLYMEADSLYAPGGPIEARKMTGGQGILIRDVRIKVMSVSSGSAMIASERAVPVKTVPSSGSVR